MPRVEGETSDLDADFAEGAGSGLDNSKLTGVLLGVCIDAEEGFGLDNSEGVLLAVCIGAEEGFGLDNSEGVLLAVCIGAEEGFGLGASGSTGGALTVFIGAEEIPDTDSGFDPAISK